LIFDTIILTQSRAVFLGLLAAIPYAFIGAPRESRKKLYMFLILGIVLFFILADPKYLTRIETIRTETQTYTQNQVQIVHEGKIDRLDFWKASLKIFADHPLGIGVKNFEKLVPQYDPRNPGNDAHNSYVLCYSEIGIFGITLFLIIIAEALLQIRRIRLMVKDTLYEKEISSHAFALGIVLLIYLLGYMVTHSNLYTEMIWILLAMPICLENSARKLKSNEEKTETGI
jgi:O-antigen ligase